MTRARVVWASSEAFEAVAGQALETALRRPRDPETTAADVRDMRALMASERPAAGFWDMKLSEGGLVDVEFCAQFLQLIHAADGGPLQANTAQALTELARAGTAPEAPLAALGAAWAVQQDLAQLLKIALEDGDDPTSEPKALRALLAKAAGTRDFRSLRVKLERLRRAALTASEALICARR
jgi:glutamate-ammonia-ligase adenylyltransferase